MQLSLLRAARWQMYFLSAILRILVNGKTAGDGKVTSTVIDFLLTDYFAERITANAFSTCRLLQRGMAMKMNRGIYAHNHVFTVYCTCIRIYLKLRKYTIIKSLETLSVKTKYISCRYLFYSFNNH